MNPYASFLGNRDPLEVIASTPNKLRDYAKSLGERRVEQAPAPGKWSAREIVCHLADTELVFSFRLRQTLAEDRYVVQPFDQDKWATNYATYKIGPALDVFSSVRAWNAALVKSLPQEAFAKKLTHPERGELTFRELVETMAGHDLNHLRQMEAIAGRFASAR